MKDVAGAIYQLSLMTWEGTAMLPAPLNETNIRD